MKKKLTGQAAGYLILAALVVASWAIFKVLTPGNFGSPKNLLSYFEASLLAAVGAVGFYFVMVMGMFDFSIGANIMLSAIVGCVFATGFGMGYFGLILGVMAVLTISYGSSMVAVTGMASMSRNFVPTMGCFFGMAFRKYGIPLPAIIIGEFVINIIFFGFIALGAPTAIQDVITGLALLLVVTLTTRITKGEIVK